MSINILQIPDEIIAHVFSFIPNHFSLREVCTRFNEISCRMKNFKIHFKSQWNESYLSFLDDDETFDSMMKSHRKVSFIQISNDFMEKNEMSEEQKERFEKVIKYLGSNVEILELNGDVLTYELLQAINIMPNIQKIVLDNIKDSVKITDEEFWLNLPKLREIKSTNCNENVLKHFSNLPKGALQKLEIVAKESSKETEKTFALFPSQENLKEVILSSNFVRFLNFQNFKLNCLIIKGSKIPLEKVIIGQFEMTKLLVGEISENDLTLICNELLSLKKLEITVTKTQSTEFYQLSKLQKLEKLKITFTNFENSAFIESVTFLENGSLSSLDIAAYHNDVTVPIMESLGVNCPKLQKLKIHARLTLNILNPIMNYFPALIEIELNGFNEKLENQFEFKCETFHKNLRKLLLIGLKTEQKQLSKVINSIEHLEELQTSMAISHELLQDIFIAQPNLKVLCLTPQWNLVTKEHKMTKQFVEVLKRYGMNLKVFKADFLVKDEDLVYETVKNEFLKTFPNMHLDQGYAITEWTMEK